MERDYIDAYADSSFNIQDKDKFKLSTKKKEVTSKGKKKSRLASGVTLDHRIKMNPQTQKVKCYHPELIHPVRLLSCMKVKEKYFPNETGEGKNGFLLFL